MTTPVARPAPTESDWAWGLLVSRTLLFLAAQAAIVAALAASGAPEPWWSSAAWWPVAATMANAVGLALLAWRLRVAGVGWRGLLLPATGSWRRDGLTALALLPLLAVAAFLPPVLIAQALWGDPTVGQSLLLAPLPGWAAWTALLLFPVTTAAVELPTYGGYVLPRLRSAGLPVVAAIAVVGLVLGVQHGALPFVPASQFFAWRTTAFVPFALALIGLLAWRPRLLPWFMGLHLLLDAAAGAQVWLASR
ncbi:MAG: hypothetical protein K0A98_10370 [Trueperaceae bacterium]|nr:hypothetical protein [Trueperaceae bacterium]